MPTNVQDNPFYSGAHNKKIIDGLNAMWAADVAGYLEIGTQILQGSGKFNMAARRRAGEVNILIQKDREKNDLNVANYFLDALSLHENERDRMAPIMAV